MPNLSRVAIVGATGATGIHLARELRQRGIRVRAISRSRVNLERAFLETDVERAVADATDQVRLRQAVDGCEAIVDCIGLPTQLMALHPVTARVIVSVAKETGARCLQVSGFWGFLPLQSAPLNEDHPRTGGNAIIQARREAEDAFLGAGAAVIHLPDFFGPHVGSSSHQGALADAAAGRPMNWIGSAEVVREAVYVPDAMRTVAELLARDEAYGRAWVHPGGGPITARSLAEVASRHLGSPVKVRAAGLPVLRLMSLFSRDLRSFMPMVPHYLSEITYDASRLRSLLGEVPITPYELAIPATLDWLRAGTT